MKYYYNNELVSASEAKSIITSECIRQWKDNQREEYGSWEDQTPEVQNEYFESLWNELIEERG